MQLFAKVWFWSALFLGTFILSMDFWAWDIPVSLGYLNFPAWISYFVLLQFLLALIMFAFVHLYWRVQKSDRVV